MACLVHTFAAQVVLLWSRLALGIARYESGQRSLCDIVSFACFWYFVRFWLQYCSELTGLDLAFVVDLFPGQLVPVTEKLLLQ